MQTRTGTSIEGMLSVALWSDAKLATEFRRNRAGALAQWARENGLDASELSGFSPLDNPMGDPEITTIKPLPTYYMGFTDPGPSGGCASLTADCGCFGTITGGCSCFSEFGTPCNCRPRTEDIDCIDPDPTDV